jgi:hypothetical protein
MLTALAGFAAVGVLGSRLPIQVRVVHWLYERRIPLGIAGWAVCAIPLCAFLIVLIARPIVARLGAGTLLIAGVLAVAAMGRPRGLDTPEWKAALGPGGADFVDAIGWSAYAILASAALAVLVYLVRRPGYTGISRLAISAGLVSITGSLVATLLT